MPEIEKLTCRCPKCLKNFNLNGKAIENRKIKVADGETLFLTVLTCSKCNNEFVVQIDNYESLNALNKQKNILSRIAINNTKSENQNEKLERKQKHQEFILLQLRKLLQDKYNGAVYYFQGEIKKIGIHSPEVHISG